MGAADFAAIAHSLLPLLLGAELRAAKAGSQCPAGTARATTQTAAGQSLMSALSRSVALLLEI